MKKPFNYILLLVLIFITSCALFPKKNPYGDLTSRPSDNSKNRATETEKTKNQVESARDNINDIKNNVLDHTINIKRKDSAGNMKPEVVGIESEMAKQEDVKKQLDSVVDDLNAHKGALIVDIQKIKDLEDNLKVKDEQYKKDKIEFEKTNSELKKQLEVSNSKYMRTLIMLSVISMAISGMMFFHKPSKESLSIGVGGAVLLVTSLAVQHYSEKFALFGFGAIIIAIGIIIWKIIEQAKIMKEKDETENSFKEVVETVELAKEKIPEPEKQILFGTRNSDGLSATIQSKTTKQKVLEARKEINDKNKPTMEG